MTETRPPPLVSAEVDLTDFAFMPLDVRKLRDSRFTATIEGDAFKVGLLLWCASWHQRPAASLPDDDIELAQLAGFGRVVKEWRKVRDGALYGWIKCSDGRLYHPTIAEKALEAWQSKEAHAYGRMCERLRKSNKARTEAGLSPVRVPPLAEWVSGGKTDPVPPETPPPSGGIPAENALKGQGQGQGQGKEKDNPQTPAEAGAGVRGFPPGFETFWAAYPRKAGKDAAAKAFAKRRVGRELLAAMLQAIEAQKRTEQWQREGGKFIPHPSTWLNEGRWQDVPDESAAPADDIFAGAK